MGKKVKIGVFGAYRGRTMIDILSDHPEAATVAICDANESALEESRKYESNGGDKITYYTDVDDFFRHDMDAIVLANYAHEHAPYAIKALDSGRHVLSEVQAVQTMNEAVELVDAVERSGKIYVYGENHCFYKSTFEMKRLFAQGAIGQFIHGEGEYIHKTVPIWHELTYGDPDHWRNRMYSTYYCTHSMGPMMSITGTRPVKVAGFETPNTSALQCGMLMGSSGMEICQMDNGATVKSLHASSVVSNMSGGSYSICGPRGMIESDRWGPYVWNGVRMRLEQEDGKSVFKDYQPDFPYQPEPPAKVLSHGGADVAMIYFFVDKILDRPQGEHCIDVYEGIDMSIVGILAYKSILAGSVPLEVPDFRIKEEREKFRGDNFGFDPKVCGGELAPSCSYPLPDIPDSVYERMKKMSEEQKLCTAGSRMASSIEKA